MHTGGSRPSPGPGGPAAAVGFRGGSSWGVAPCLAFRLVLHRCGLSPIDRYSVLPYGGGMESKPEQRRQDMGARIQAVVLVAVVLVTGYLVGMVATGAVRAWLETTVMGGM